MTAYDEYLLFDRALAVLRREGLDPGPVGDLVTSKLGDCFFAMTDGERDRLRAEAADTTAPSEAKAQPKPRARAKRAKP